MILYLVVRLLDWFPVRRHRLRQSMVEVKQPRLLFLQLVRLDDEAKA